MLNAVMTEQSLGEFELEHHIKLPEGYRDFLKYMGNGGAGPYYGLEPLGNGLFMDLDYKDRSGKINPSLEFGFTDAWNLPISKYEDTITDEEYELLIQKREQEYFDPKWTNGLLRICNFGCGVSINLVVNGPEYGHIWVDDRCNDGGVYPDHYFGNKERLGFLDWYELWLDSVE